MPDEARCVWCHKSGGTLKTLPARVPNTLGTVGEVSVAVHPEHEAELSRFLAYQRRYARLFLLLVLLGVVALLIFAALGWEAGATSVIAYYGVLFIVFPFATPTTVEMIGMKSSVRLVRVAGFVLLVAGFHAVAVQLLKRLETLPRPRAPEKHS